MNVICKIDDRKFVVEMEENELKYQLGEHIAVVHDYVNIVGSAYVGGKENIYPRVALHLPIREMIQLVLPYLQEHPNMRREHLLQRDKDGVLRENYAYYEGDITLHGDETYQQREDGTLCQCISKHYVRHTDETVYHVTETKKGYILPKNLKEHGYKEIDLPDEVKEYDIDMHEI